MGTPSIRYTLQTPEQDIRLALLADGLKRGQAKEAVLKHIDKAMEEANSDITIKKGLIHFLNW